MSDARSVAVRVGTEDDRQFLIDANRAMAEETEARDLPLNVVGPGVEFLLGNPQFGFYLIAECADDRGENQIAGTLSITYEWSDWRNGFFWWIQSVYVKPEFRGRGVYRELHKFIRSLAREEGNVVGFRLYVEKQNTRAQQTYRSIGMAETVYDMYEELLS